MKKDKNQDHDASRKIKTPRPPQVIDPSKPANNEESDSLAESPNGKIKRKPGTNPDRDLAPGEKL